MKNILLLSFLFLPLQIVNATLIDRGNGLVYDTDLNITWLSDANYAQTSGYDSDGLMNWNEAIEWADQLEYRGFNNWRLPTTTQPDSNCSFHNSYVDAGYNCTASEMGYLFYEELGGTQGSSISQQEYFTNIELGRYWSSTTVAPSDPNNSWFFDFSSGWQGGQLQSSYIFSAWAVHDGDIANVPAPSALFLMATGMLLIWKRNMNLSSHV